MSKQIKLRCCLFFMDLNHSITEAVFFHWLNLAALMILLLILSRILLLILPISDLVGLISRQVGLLKSEAIHETGLSGNVVASFFPLKMFIPLCFNVLSTVPRENRLTDSLLCSRLVEHSTIIRHGKIQRHLLHKEYSASITK